MGTKIFASYLRVSTQKQGRSQLGLSSQREICNGFIERNGGILGQEFVDIESGTHRDRKGLWKAIEYCNKMECPLVIATLSRLARDVEFCFKVVNTGVEIHFVDMPQISTLLLGIFATVAQYERELTAQRTRNALGELQKKGVKLGAANAKYVENYNKKSERQKKEESMRRGYTKNIRFLESKETSAWLKILRQVFPKATNGEPVNWKWELINTQKPNRVKMFSLMKDYKEMDDSGALFRRWLLDNDEWCTSRNAQMKLNSKISGLRKSFVIAHKNSTELV